MRCSVVCMYLFVSMYVTQSGPLHATPPTASSASGTKRGRDELKDPGAGGKKAKLKVNMQPTVQTTQHTTQHNKHNGWRNKQNKENPKVNEL